ncbi:MAG TPA: DJ-1/PfpI family protein [Pilimelia sp.]|nr:DJ-1/PfpI family protein [Pilimelia sp.]
MIRPVPADRCDPPGTWLARQGFRRTRKPAAAGMAVAVRPQPRHLARRPAAINAQIVLFDGFDLLDATAAHEVLRAGGMASGGALTVELVSPSQPGVVTAGSAGLVLQTTGALDPGRANLIILPGAAELHAAPADHREVDTVPPALARALQTELPILMKDALDDPDVTVAAIGGGVLMLAMAGLIEGRPVVTHHRGVNLLEEGDALADARVVDDGDLVTAGGITAGLDLGLHLLERELGPRIAHRVEQLLAYERRGTAWRPAGAAPVL